MLTYARLVDKVTKQELKVKIKTAARDSLLCSTN